MGTLRSVPGALWDKLEVSHERFLRITGRSQFATGIALAALVGLATALAAVVFRWALVGSESFFAAQATRVSLLARFAVALIPAVGGLLAGLLWWKVAPEVRGPGVAGVIEAVALGRSRIRPRVAPAKIAATALTLGSGGSGGAEGPVVQIGASVGSSVAQVFRLPEGWVRVLVACGAAGAISALFNTPIAGVFFSLEVILRRINPQNFGFVVVSAVLADVVSHAVFGDRPLFTVPPFQLVSPWEIGLYAVLGALAALASVAFIRLLFYVDDRSRGSSVPPFLQPAVGGLLVGLLGLVVPQVLGVGYQEIDKALHYRTPYELLLVLVVLKLVATSITVGTGGSGGVFGPSLFIGAALGGAFGVWAHHLFPSITAPSGAYALVGMAALLAGTMRAPITAVLMVFEMSRDYGLILPLLTGVVVSTGLSALLSRGTIFTERLRRQGIDVDHASREEEALLRGIHVGDVMRRSFTSLGPDLPLPEVIQRFGESGTRDLPVTGEGNRLLGMISLADVGRTRTSGLAARDVMTSSSPTLHSDQSLHDVLNRLDLQDLDGIPVIDRATGVLLGFLSHEDILMAYLRATSSPPAAEGVNG